MRDDLHRAAPVPFHYRQMIKECCRGGPRWEECALVRAERGLIREIEEEVSPNFIARLNENLASPQWELDLVADQSRWRGAGASTPLERRIIDHLDRRLQDVQTGTGALFGAIDDALSERGRAHLREIDCHIVSKHQSSRNEAIARIAPVMQQIPTRRLADAICRGERISPPVCPGRTHLGVDEDLR